ncbi:MAG: hypothetical protein KGZ65_04085 [Sphingomonadales bacterium]|nr:hypothetical protein [Sphingomonadaceae bacterium]MBS3930392.1 hypothetical protein [Sphingomonadales bacterium]
MQQDMKQRAENGLRDYLIYLRDKGDASESYAVKRTFMERSSARGNCGPHKARGDFGTMDGIGADTARSRRSVDLWEKRKLNSWRAGGRLTASGLLRVSTRLAKPWTLEQVAKAAPEANFWDHLAALIILDGVVRRRFMDSLKNIREVVEGIADERLQRSLLDPNNSGPIRSLIREEIGHMFGELLGVIQRKVPQQEPSVMSRGQRKCSRCGVLGHTAKTCQARGPVAPDKWACMKCSDKEGRTLDNPVTHEVRSEEFHDKDDETQIQGE